VRNDSIAVSAGLSSFV